MLAVFDAAIHVDAANLASVPLNGRRRIDHAELVAVLRAVHLVLRHDGHDRERRPFGFPALGTAASVVMRDLRADRYFDGPVRAFARQGSSSEVLRSLLDAVIDRRMN